MSDFGLNDAIESGLVKTPRVVARDDRKLRSDYKSRFYHIYSDPDVKTDVNRKAEPQVPLPGLVVNGYYFLGKDWLETARAWKKAKGRCRLAQETGSECNRCKQQLTGFELTRGADRCEPRH